jgi:protocatechuate 3,4-dioxygenase beta subunit
MYFAGDQLLSLDPIFNSVPEHARERLIARYDHEVTEENWALGWRWDIVLRGAGGTPLEDESE